MMPETESTVVMPETAAEDASSAGISIPRQVGANDCRGTKRPILVTGAHASGTTWVGKMISLTEECRYFHDPFNRIVHPDACLCGFRNNVWFPYLDPAKDYPVILKHIRHLTGHPFNIYDLHRRWKKCATLQERIKFLKKSLNYLHPRYRGERTVVKDPISIFAAEWMAVRFDMNVIVMIRHPYAFAGSLKRMNWRFDFGDFLSQQDLMARYLSPFEAEFSGYRQAERPLAEQAALLWKSIYSVVRLYQVGHPDWIFLRHEDVSIDPVTHFKEIYRKLGLTCTPEIGGKMAESSSSKNPKSAAAGERNYRLDSRENLWAWKDRLSRDEIEKIDEITGDLSRHFYDRSFWQ